MRETLKRHELNDGVLVDWELMEIGSTPTACGTTVDDSVGMEITKKTTMGSGKD